MKVKIIANPVAGKGLGRTQAEALAKCLEVRGADVNLVMTRVAGEGRKEAGEPRADAIVVVGGDGSLNEVLNGLNFGEADLGVLPVGTANVVAREMSVPSNPEVVAELVVSGIRHPMDVGVCHDRRFLLGCGAGIDGAVAHAVTASRGKRSSLLKWVGPAFRAVFSYDFAKIRVEADGEEAASDAEWVVVGNCRYSAGVFAVTPRAKTDDGLLDVCIFRNLSPFKFPRLIFKVFGPNFVDDPAIQYLQCKTLTLSAADGGAIPVQVDGDSAGALPATVTTIPQAVTFIGMPAEQ